MVPIAVQNELNHVYDACIAKEIWKLATFDEYGTPVVQVRKQCLCRQSRGTVRVYDDYSVFINSQLETHRQPTSLSKDLIRRLGKHTYLLMHTTRFYLVQKAKNGLP